MQPWNIGLRTIEPMVAKTSGGLWPSPYAESGPQLIGSRLAVPQRVRSGKDHHGRLESRDWTEGRSRQAAKQHSSCCWVRVHAMRMELNCAVARLFDLAQGLARHSLLCLL